MSQVEVILTGRTYYVADGQYQLPNEYAVMNVLLSLHKANDA